MSSDHRHAADILRACREGVLKAAPDITDALIAKAREGSYQHAKFLFDLVTAALPKPKDEDDDLPGPSLAEILLERLQLLDPEESASGNTPESGAVA